MGPLLPIIDLGNLQMTQVTNWGNAGQGPTCIQVRPVNGQAQQSQLALGQFCGRQAPPRASSQACVALCATQSGGRRGLTQLLEPNCGQQTPYNGDTLGECRWEVGAAVTVSPWQTLRHCGRLASRSGEG